MQIYVNSDLFYNGIRIRNRFIKTFLSIFAEIICIIKDWLKSFCYFKVFCSSILDNLKSSGDT